MELEEAADYDAVLVECYQWLRAHRGRMVIHGEADAQDLIHETMERFLRRFPGRLPSKARCKGWLLRTLGNLVISHWRKQHVRKKAQVDPALEGAQWEREAPEPGMPARALLDHLHEQALLEAVSQLRPKLRVACQLQLMGLSNALIAERLCINKNAVSKRLHDACKCLRPFLRGDAPFQGPHYAVRRGPRDPGPAVALAS